MRDDDSIPPHSMVVTTYACPVCDKSEMFTVPTAQYERWISGTHAQHAFTGMSAAEADLLITGIHEGCFDTYMHPKVASVTTLRK